MNLNFFGKYLQEWRMRGDPDCQRMLIYRYWNLLIIIFGMSVVVAVCFDAWTFLVASTKTPPVVEVGPDTVETISRERLRTVLDTFADRETRFQTLSQEPPAITDPSR